MAGFNPDVLDSLMAARGLSLTDVAERVGLSVDELQHRLSDTSGVSDALVAEIAHQLVVPPYTLYMETAPAIAPPIVDFRRNRPSHKPIARDTIKAIDLARRIGEVASNLGHQDSRPPIIEIDKILGVVPDIRRQLGLTAEIQIKSRDVNAFYNIVRRSVEGMGIFVLHDSFPSEDGSGFCLFEGNVCVIVINTFSQNIGRRLFTLCHELAHALTGYQGLSDPFITKNSIERTCNLFASRLLMPRNIILFAASRIGIDRNPSLYQVRQLSRIVKASQEAIAVRLEQLSLVDTGYHAHWLAQVSETGNPDWDTSSGGGGGVPQEKVKLAQYGTTFAEVFKDALESRRISPVEIYRISGLKPQYQLPYFNLVDEMGA